MVNSFNNLGKSRSFIFALSFVAVYYLFIILNQGNDNTLLIGANLFQLLAPAISCFWLYGTYLQAKKESRFFWLNLSLGALCYTIAETIWIYNELILKVEPPFPSYADIFWILISVFYLIAMLSKIYLIKQLFLTIRFFLDTLIIIGVVLTLSWNTLISPILQASRLSQSVLHPFVAVGIHSGI